MASSSRKASSWPSSIRARFQAQLDQAEANLARDQAHLENAQINLSRYVPLAKKGFAPEQQVATQQAMIAQQQATIKGDQAAIEYAKTQLGYTKLVAPFDGVAGIRLLDVGNIIHATTSRGSPSEPNALVVINQVQPISVMFTLAAADIRRCRTRSRKGSVEGHRIERGRQDGARYRHARRDRQPGRTPPPGR